ncbi:MAG TPA: PLP-dependent transferase [Dongiaceae bacterium]|nr:PLP-dependent transferase [Dongiaceae bacterium]
MAEGRTDLKAATQLSPLRNTTTSQSIDALVQQQLAHFSIDPNGAYGLAMGDLARHLYGAGLAVNDLWRVTVETLGRLDRADRIAWFNAKRFACFQIAKILDNLQNPMRATYQSLASDTDTRSVKGPYPIFDNVAAIFSATPVITRTATYLYACTEWVEDAFKGRELMHDIYSRLLNPTSISLANHIVDLEAGPLAGEYMAWNFNSGMAAIDATVAHLVGFQDIVVSSRNTYGGTYQLLHDWYGKRSNMDVAVEWFDGFEAADFNRAFDAAREKHRDRLAQGRRIYVYVESPCNPHGYTLDVPGICLAAHAAGSDVICDATVGTPFLQKLLQHPDPAARPDFLIHSYTKDIAGSGTTTAGVCIGRNERMFIPKGLAVELNGRKWNWDETLFWNVYYVKGAFLDADKAFEVLNGMRTLPLRVLAKCINTIVLAKALARHPGITVNCSVIDGNPNSKLREHHLFLGLPPALFTIDFEPRAGGRFKVGRPHVKRLFDCLEPSFGLQVSLGQTGTIVLCPALTSHSELSDEALKEAGIAPTTIRVSVGDEDPRGLIAHLIQASRLAIEPDNPGFVAAFPSGQEIDRLYRETYLEVHRRYAEAQPGFDRLMQ